MTNTKLADKRLHLLITDDDIDDIDFFRAAVEDIASQTKITVASDCFEMTEFLKIISPDIIFLDINMPKKNGLECLAEIRANKAYDHMPVIIYTTSTNPKHVEDSFNRGASMFFEKPVSYNLIKTRLLELLSYTTTDLIPQLPWEKYYVKGNSADAA